MKGGRALPALPSSSLGDYVAFLLVFAAIAAVAGFSKAVKFLSFTVALVVLCVSLLMIGAAILLG